MSLTLRVLATDQNVFDGNADEVTILVNKAELGSAIDGSAAEADFQKASTTVAGMEGQPASPEKLKAQQQLNMARARMQASKNAE